MMDIRTLGAVAIRRRSNLSRPRPKVRDASESQSASGLTWQFHLAVDHQFLDCIPVKTVAFADPESGDLTVGCGP